MYWERARHALHFIITLSVAVAVTASKLVGYQALLILHAHTANNNNNCNKKIKKANSETVTKREKLINNFYKFSPWYRLMCWLSCCWSVKMGSGARVWSIRGGGDERAWMARELNAEGGYLGGKSWSNSSSKRWMNCNMLLWLKPYCHVAYMATKATAACHHHTTP